MPTDNHFEDTVLDNGEASKKLVVEFTNGSLQQLEDLADFFDVKDDNPTEVVKLGISFLQNIKDKHDGTPKPPKS